MSKPVGLAMLWTLGQCHNWLSGDWEVCHDGTPGSYPWSIRLRGMRYNSSDEGRQALCFAQASTARRVVEDLVAAMQALHELPAPNQDVASRDDLRLDYGACSTVVLTARYLVNHGRRGRITASTPQGAYLLLFPTVLDPEPEVEFYWRSCWEFSPAAGTTFAGMDNLGYMEDSQ